MTDIAGLIERLEEATGADRELDGLLQHPTKVHPSGPAALYVRDEDIPAYTASLDAALALVERVQPGVWYRIGRGRNHPDEPLYGAQLMLADVPGDEDGAVIGEGEHNASLALALLIALLRTLETEQ